MINVQDHANEPGLTLGQYYKYNFNVFCRYTNGGKAYGSESDYGSDYGQEDPYRNAAAGGGGGGQPHPPQQPPSESDYQQSKYGGNSTLGRRSRH